ncbi:MAG: T9SS type A sorting domain-containing protein [Saprospiraceae bacterium]|nr:T9SS type A sorting domain-containing protein [Saprospiraceae bacterium]
MRVIIILLLLLFTYSLSLAQVYQEIIRQNTDLTFEQIVERVENYYKGKDQGKGSGYKQFKRWEYYNSTRLGEDGKIQNVPRRVLDEFLRYSSIYQPPPNLNLDCEWESVGGNTYQRLTSGRNGGLGRVNAILLDPGNSNIIYAGTPAGGLWRTDNAGGTWTPGSTVSNWVSLTDGIPVISISGIAIDPTSPSTSRTIYILTGDGDGSDNSSIGVLKSFDGGQTWSQTGLSWGVRNFNYGYKLVMHPTDPNTLFAATSTGLFRTTNGGINWTQEIASQITDVEFRPGTPATMYAVSATTFFRSTDTGDNWTPINCNITNTGIRLAIAVTPANANYVYVLSGGTLLDAMGNGIGGTYNGVYRSTDSGMCFQTRSTTPNILGDQPDGTGTRQQPGYDLSIAASPTDAEEVHVGGINSWRSLDGGQNWTITARWEEHIAAAGDYNHADVHALEYIGNTLYSGSDGGVYISTNRADDWVNISQGLMITQFYRIAVFTDDSVNYVMGGTQDNGLNQLRDVGAGFGTIEHWEGADGFECSVDVANNFVYGATQNGCLNRFSYPSGAMTNVSPFSMPCGVGAWLTPHTFDPVNSAILMGFTDVQRGTNNGGTWTNISNGNIGMGLCSHIDIAPSDDSIIYVSKATRLFRTTDAGGNWTDITGTLPATMNNVITYFTIHPTDPNQIWVTLGGFIETSGNGYTANNKVFYSNNAGATWQNISGTLPNVPANCIIYENGSNNGVYVGMDVGVYYRDNNLSDWILFSNNLPNVIIAELDINYTTGKLYAGTFGRGIWCTDLFSACSRVCLDCPVFNEIQSLNNTYASKNCIYSTSWVFDDANITYEAKDFIKLDGNFYADGSKNTNFFATIKSCALAGGSSVFKVTNQRKLSGYYIGTLSGLSTSTFNEESVIGKTALKVYPNPSQNLLNIEFEMLQSGLMEMNLYDILGNKVQVLQAKTPFDKALLKRSYNIQNLPNGTYVLEAVSNGNRYFQTVIKTGSQYSGQK